jgi:hypothetical protein
LFARVIADPERCFHCAREILPLKPQRQMDKVNEYRNFNEGPYDSREGLARVDAEDCNSNGDCKLEVV